MLIKFRADYLMDIADILENPPGTCMVEKGEESLLCVACPSVHTGASVK